MGRLLQGCKKLLDNILRKHQLKNKLYTDHNLAEYTSWKIGGPADYFYQPQDLDDLVAVLTKGPQTSITVLGGGSNVLVKDRGVRGLVVYLHNSLKVLDDLGKGVIKVGAGVGLARLVQYCGDLGMLDVAFMAGIPGTVGGALKMNAGAYGKFIWSYVRSVATINRMGKIKTRYPEEFLTGYRNIGGLADDEWFIEANLAFDVVDRKLALSEIDNNIQQRKKSQPLDLPSCGSVFRNPPGNYAARLIESAGLKGKAIGGAKVSEKHANFILNFNHATAQDVEQLMQIVVEVVEKNSGIILIPEVHILGE